MNWQSIETAPKDGTYCKFKYPRHLNSEPFETEASWYPPNDELGWWLQRNGCDFGSPTHWMPLPEPPTT